MSIIIPVYNSERYLAKTLESILEQTYPNKEIIVIDDSSTDNSFTIAKSFEAKGIKVLRQKNAGAAVARNTGLASATGDYIQFLDADDYLSNDKIEKQVMALDGATDKVAVCNYVSFTNDKELEKKITPPDQSSYIFSSDDPVSFLLNLWGSNGESEFIQTNCWLVPHPLIKKAGPWRNYRCPDDDGEFFTRVILAGRDVVYVPGVINYYRREITKHKLSANAQRKYLQNTLLNIDLKYQYIKDKAPEDDVRKAFAKQYYDFAIYNYPQQRLLSKIALKRFQQMNEKAKLPLLGGNVVELIKNVFGWKAARWLKYYFG